MRSGEQSEIDKISKMIYQNFRCMRRSLLTSRETAAECFDSQSASDIQIKLH